MTQERIVLVDAMNLVYRSHYACRGLQTKEGFPTGALHGFLKALLRLKPYGPILVCWDSTKGRWRNKIYPAYKANRTNSPDKELVRQQLEPLRRGLQILNVPQLEIEELEADDLIALISQQKPSWIYSNDRDLYQLLSPTVGILQSDSKGQLKPLLPKAIEKEYGVPIDRWAEYLALGGDNSDNIRPIPKCGPKTAAKMLIAGLYLNAEFQPANYSLPVEFAKYDGHWGKVYKAYEITRLPLTLTDPRLPRQTEARWHRAIQANNIVKAVELEQWTRFLAEFELVELIAKRREFVHVHGSNPSGTKAHVRPVPVSRSRS